MDIGELDKEHCSCACVGGDVAKDAVKVAMKAVVATALFGDNISAVRFVSVELTILHVGEDAERIG
eukprot:5556592-Ditylum_brightwellii.AAC.2